MTVLVVLVCLMALAGLFVVTALRWWDKPPAERTPPRQVVIEAVVLIGATWLVAQVVTLLPAMLIVALGYGGYKRSRRTV